MSAAPVDNPFWDWAVQTWRRPGLETGALALQDAHAVLVPALLFAYWCSREQVLLPAGFRQDLALENWQFEVLDPLRRARRRLAMLGGKEAAAYRALRNVELDLERQLMARMYACAGWTSSAGMTPEALLRENLERALGEMTTAAGRAAESLQATLVAD